MNRNLFLTTLAALAVNSAASAHDLWLIPKDRISVNSPTTISAVSGMEFPTGDQAPDTARFIRRVVVAPNGRESPVPATGVVGKSGLMEFTPAVAGIHILAVETEPKVLALEAAEFNEYLVTDGLPHIYQLRMKERSLNQPSRERYSKTPKAIFKVGESSDGDPARVLGLTLEIVPLRNPLTLRRGETLPVRVLFRGKPLPDVHLGWQLPGDGELPRGTVRTDANGEALIPIVQPGLMAIRLTHMTRPKTADYEWESFWTSLTIHISQ